MKEKLKFIKISNRKSVEKANEIELQFFKKINKMNKLMQSNLRESEIRHKYLTPRMEEGTSLQIPRILKR